LLYIYDILLPTNDILLHVAHNNFCLLMAALLLILKLFAYCCLHLATVTVAMHLRSRLKLVPSLFTVLMYSR